MHIAFSPKLGKISGAHARPNSFARLHLRKPTSSRFGLVQLRVTVGRLGSEQIGV